MRLINLLFVLLINAVPLVGVRYYGWSASTIVVLYWCENLLNVFFTCARIALHRKLTRKRGYWRGGQLGTSVNNKPSTAGLLGEFAVASIVFTLAHGVFVFAFTLIAAGNHPDDPLWAVSKPQLLQGLQWMAVLMVAEFLIDAATIRTRSFAWIKAYVGQRMGRVIIMHLTIIFGMGAMMMTESPFAVLYVLIGLKTLWDLAASNASAKAAELPPEPPAWALRFAGKLGKDKGGAEALQREWERDRARLIAAAREDEEVMPE
jgi:Family of unknown function (DUF6498)